MGGGDRAVPAVHRAHRCGCGQRRPGRAALQRQRQRAPQRRPGRAPAGAGRGAVRRRAADRRQPGQGAAGGHGGRRRRAPSHGAHQGRHGHGADRPVHRVRRRRLLRGDVLLQRRDSAGAARRAGRRDARLLELGLTEVPGPAHCGAYTSLVRSGGELLDPGRRVLVVMPAYTEEDSIAAAIAEVRATNPTVDVLVVDDGSSDATAVIAERAGVPVCRLPYNLGVGGAMRAGYRYAVRHDYDVVVQIDADGQHDPRYLPALVARLDEADLVIGVRFADQATRYEVSRIRRLAMLVLARTLSRMAHTRLTDVTSGFR